jgi:CDP-paratose 2-epimerase
MNIAIISGSHGLIGSECVSFLADNMDLIIGIDNDQRAYFFGKEASTEWNKSVLENKYQNYKAYNFDIRDYSNLEKIFNEYGKDVKLVIHTAAQPSHDWAAKEPIS